MSTNSKLLSAIAPVAARVSLGISGVVGATECGALRQNEALDTRNEKTKPNRSPATLSPRQLMAAVMLVSGKSVTQTAMELGVARATVDRWKRLPAFDAEVRRRVEATVVAREKRRAGQSAASVRQRLSAGGMLAQLEARLARRERMGNLTRSVPLSVAQNEAL